MTFSTILQKGGKKIVKHKYRVLLISGVLTLISLLATTRIGIDTDIARLLPPDNRVARTFTRITKSFQSTSTLITVIQGSNRTAIIAAAEEFAQEIQNDPQAATLIKSVQLKADRNFAKKWGFLLQEKDELEDNHVLFASTRLLPLLQTTNNILEDKLSDGDNEEVEGAEGEDDAFSVMSRFSLFAEQFLAAVRTTDGKENLSQAARNMADAWIFGEEYFFDPEEKTLLLQIRPTFTIGDREKLSLLSKMATEIGARVTQKSNAENSSAMISFSFTGDIENEAAEEKALGADVFYPTLIALVLILFLFFFSFNRRRSILFALVALVCGIIIDLGFTALTVKNLNMITSSFGALLVGLGIDFGIHIASRFDEAMNNGESPEEAIGQVYREVAAPIIVGGLTTAIAFYSLLFSHTIAFKEFGLVAGTGILTTLGSAFIILPALLAAFPGKPRVQSSSRKISFLPIARSSLLFSSHRAFVFFVVIVVTLGAAICIPKNRFNYDMRSIGPRESSSKTTEALVSQRFGISVWQHMALADSIDTARFKAELCKTAPLVRRVESIADYIPEDGEQDARLMLIQNIATQTNRTDWHKWNKESLALLRQEIQRLEWNMIELGDLAAASRGENALPVRKRNDMIREVFGADTGKSGKEVFSQLITALSREDEESLITVLNTLDSEFAISLDSIVTELSSVNRHISISDIPQNITMDLVSDDETEYLVIIHGDAALSTGSSFINFADGLSAVDPEATGSLTLGLELSREILQESRRMGFIVLFVVVGIVLLMFRSIKKTLIVCAGFFCSFIVMYGLSPFFGEFNIVNALAIPLIIGIGIDYCVHLLSAINSTEPGAYEKTIKSVTLSMLTTLFGFGSLALAGQFKGIADLGTTLTIGIISCYVFSIILIPALVRPTQTKQISGGF